MADRERGDRSAERAHPVSPEREITERDELAEMDQLEREGMPRGMAEREAPPGCEEFSGVVPMNTGESAPAVERTDQTRCESWPVTGGSCIEERERRSHGVSAHFRSQR